MCRFQQKNTFFSDSVRKNKAKSNGKQIPNFDEKFTHIS